jgi:regulator of protease activity HflC (stomatin/prohibitin superfamily)
MPFGPLEIVGLVAALYTLSSLRIIKQYERGVSFFLGRYWNTKGPGITFLPSFIAHMHKVSLRTLALDIPPQDVITRDNVSVKVNAVLYMRVKDPAAAIIQIENYLYATSQMAQTTLRSVLGEHQLDDLLSEREKINNTLKTIIDTRTDDWGIEVTAVEVKDVDLPENMKRAMAKQAEAERERRAKIINAEGELQASEKLAQAAHVIGSAPAAIQLRYLQTVSEIASEKNSTTFFPIPLDIFKSFGGLLGGGGQAATLTPQDAQDMKDGRAAREGRTLGSGTGPRTPLTGMQPEAALPPARDPERSTPKS